MSSINRVTLLGHLGRDPEVRSFQNGGRVANLRLATTEKWKDKHSGEQKERTEWHSIAIHADGLIGVVERYLRKGSKVYIEGQLQTRKWQDQAGNDRYSTEVVIRPYAGSLIMLDGRRDGDGSGSGVGSSSGGYGGSSSSSGYGGGAPGGGLDDEIPFAPEVR